MKFILRLPHRDLWYGTGSVSGLELYNMHIVELQAAYAVGLPTNREMPPCPEGTLEISRWWSEA